MDKQKLFAALVLVALLLSAIPGVGYAQESTPSETGLTSVKFPQASIAPPDVLRDKELAGLWEKYDGLVRSGEVSLEELQALIANEKSEKARELGIKIVVHDPLSGTYSDRPDSKMQPLGLSLCIREIWGPGKVVWNFSNPGQNGAKYSVLPENSYSLIWAQAPQQSVDGLYRASWGACTAYKIPDSATATFQNADSWQVCYNAFACSALGHCPKWVNPCNNGSSEGSWPDSPLW